MPNSRPTGVGHFNSNVNDLLLDPNLLTLSKQTRIYVVENADKNLDSVTTYKALLLEISTLDFDWCLGEYDVETSTWTQIDSDTAVIIGNLPQVLAMMPINSMNSPATETEALAIKAMMGF